MKTRAAVAWEAGKPLEIEEIDLAAPKDGEVLLRNVATGVCHTDAFTLSGEDPEGLFPAVLGHEGGSIVEEVGPGVKGLKPGDHVIPLYIVEPDYWCLPDTSGRQFAFLQESLADLQTDLHGLGSDLVIRVGDAIDVMAKIYRTVKFDQMISHEETGNCHDRWHEQTAQRR